jgi:ApaG protein
MITKISEGVEISVETFYQEGFSNPANAEYMFAYRIKIINLNSFSIQLINRHWLIADSNLEHREVEGEGVVGLQPIIHPNTSFVYTSGCNLKSEIGKMAGHYLMQNLNTLQNFKVVIPTFNLIVPAKLN